MSVMPVLEMGRLAGAAELSAGQAPAQAGQAPIWIDLEAEELHTVRSTSPRPWQTSQVTGTMPSARPPPLW